MSLMQPPPDPVGVLDAGREHVASRVIYPELN
jgi:hypothetical protein